MVSHFTKSKGESERSALMDKSQPLDEKQCRSVINQNHRIHNAGTNIMDHIDQAVYDTVHSSDLSAKEIARNLGMSHQVLLNKANPQAEGHKLTLREAVAIMLMTGNHRIQSAIETELGVAEVKPKKSVIESVLDSAKEHGDVVRVVQKALDDGNISLRELEECQQEIDEAIDSLARLREVLVDEQSKSRPKRLESV